MNPEITVVYDPSRKVRKNKSSEAEGLSNSSKTKQTFFNCADSFKILNLIRLKDLHLFSSSMQMLQVAFIIHFYETNPPVIRWNLGAEPAKTALWLEAYNYEREGL